MDQAEIDKHIASHHFAKRIPFGIGEPVEAKDISEVIENLRQSSIFKYCSENYLTEVAKNMRKVEFKANQILITQGEPQTKVYLLSSGTVVRLRFEGRQLHHIETVGSGQGRGMFGALHVLRAEPTYATALTETDGIAYTLESKVLNEMIDKNPELGKQIVYSLSKEVFHMSKLRTPLLEQDPHPANVFSTSLGACIESYYRSGLNAWLNAKLSGKPPESLFPNFHIQIPARVMYINGFKQIRSFLAENVNTADFKQPGLVRLGAALVPGLIMTPVSSLLEACNAGHMNPEPLYKRWYRGVMPRGVREVIFGLGINQLSDACEERVSGIENAFAKTCAGSLMAGMLSGYLSHVPHSISTLKLLKPNLPYPHIIRDMVDENIARTPKDWLPGARRAFASLLTVFLPKGCLIRTAQICGSFIIINGTIATLDNRK